MIGTITHNTAVTRFVEGDGLRFAYRMLGPASGLPLVLCHRFRGIMDDWDPALVDGLAARRRVVLFDSAGVGLSTGETPDNIKGMAGKAVEFIRRIGFTSVDVLGFSLGGYVAQIVALDHPGLVRRLVLAGTGPGGGEGFIPAGPEIRQIAGRPTLGLEEYLKLFFCPSPTSQAAGRLYWQRLHERPQREPPVSRATLKAQTAAVVAWAEGRGSALARLNEIAQPVLVANGNDDVMVPTANSFVMARKIRNAMLIVYPDAGHGFLFQHSRMFIRNVLGFLEPNEI